MEKKKGSLSTVFLVIAIILIVVMGALLYMQKTEADRQIAELESNASEMQETINDLKEKNDLTTNTIDSKDIYEKCENKFSNVEYRRETGGSSGFFIKAGVLYSGEENLTETHSKTTGIVGKAKYVAPVNKQTGIAVVLTENGKLFINKELSNDFSSILEEHKILEIINIPNEDGHLLLASDGKILKLDGTLYLDLLEDEVKYDVEIHMSELESVNYSYNAQLKALEDKYKGKTVKITGYVSNLGDDALEPGRTYVNIGNSTTYKNKIYAGGVTSDNVVKGQIDKLEEGQKISIVGVAFKTGTPEESSFPMTLHDIKIIEE